MARLGASGGGGAASNVFVTNGALGGTPTTVYNYNEITNIAPSVETTIVSYTVNSAADCYLQIIASSGQNIGEIRVYRNGSVIDKKYLYYTGFNMDFDYRNADPAFPGLLLSTGDVIYVKGVNNSTSNCSFNAKIQVVEVT